MLLAIAQINPTVGDIAATEAKLAHAIDRAEAAEADLLLTPELSLCGYPPMDLLLVEGFVQACEEAAHRLASRTSRTCVILSAPWRDGDHLRNRLLVAREGAIVAHYDKRLLPTYDVFDEDRYFAAGDAPTVIDVAGVRVGLSVCEDLWRGVDAGTASKYEERADPIDELVAAGAQLIVNPSASPFALRKVAIQRRVLTETVRKHNVKVAAVNQVGANDELVFAGSAAVYTPDAASPSGGRLIAAGASFKEDFLLIDLPSAADAKPAAPAVEDPMLAPPPAQLLWEALTLGVRDYCAKTGFTNVVLGLSGGVDSTVAACVAVAALGQTNVLGVLAPSRYSSQGSLDDARALAQALGMKALVAPIEAMHTASSQTLEPIFAALGACDAPGATEENVQARIRGLLFMAISNKTGALLLTTGNKSELAVGYCTLYGDMNGGLAVLADVLKTQVYELARWINSAHDQCGFDAPPIPPDVLTKAPSAELIPNQTDQDTLPPYETLDAIVERYVEDRHSTASIARELRLDPQFVARITRLIDQCEYKRRQLTIGIKVTSVAFGTGRRMPIAQGWRQPS